MTKFLPFLILFVALGCNSSQNVMPTNKIAVGTSKTSFDKLVATLGAKDIGQDMAFAGPTSGIIWEFADYDAVVSVSFDNANSISHLDYCSVDDFAVSKSHRSDSTTAISEITFSEDKSITHLPAKLN